MKNRFGIKFKMVAIFAMTVVVILTTVVAISSVTNANNAMEIARNYLATATTQVINSIDQLFEERVLLVQSVAESRYVADFMQTGDDRKTVEELLSTQFSTYKQFENIFLADRIGKIVLDGKGGEARGVDVTTYPFWELAKNRLAYHADDVVYRSPVTNRIVIVVATRIENAAGDFLGLVCLSMDWEMFTAKYIDSVKIGESGYVCVIDATNNFIAHPDKSMLLTSAASASFMKPVIENDSGFLRFTFNGESKFLGYRKMKTVDFKAGTVMKESEYLTGFNTANILVTAGSVFIGIVGLFIILLFTNAVSGGIRLIAEGARRFSIGDFVLEGMSVNKITKINARKDELGDIGKAFNALIAYLREKTALAEKIADSDLDVEAPVSSERDNLGKALKRMVATLNSLISQIRSSAEQVSSGSSQVASSAQSLSQGASEQASSIEEITSAITEINGQSKQNADNAQEANGLAARSKEYAENGNRMMGDLIAAMKTINNSSEEVKKIVKTIDDIAFQINLLALNANVEAARAGKYGKGFAVVAEEVRNLAARSAGSAKDTSLMVETAIKNIETGNKLVEETAKQFTDIMDGASKVVELVEEISVASKEQAEGMEQINTGLHQIDQVTQSNTANAEESASAAEELSSQAQQLKSIVSRFKIAVDSNGRDDKNGMQWEELKKYINEEVIRNYMEEMKRKNKAPGNGNGKLHAEQTGIDVVKTRKLSSPADVISLDDDEFGNF